MQETPLYINSQIGKKYKNEKRQIMLTCQKKARVGMLLQKPKFQSKEYLQDNGHFTMVRVIQQKDITILNIYAPSNKTSKYLEQKLIKSRE